jgi:predicted MPP superfamily phosphohydrolase
VYVSRGLGCSGVPVRFASRPELTLFTLKSA